MSLMSPLSPLKLLRSLVVSSMALVSTVPAADRLDEILAEMKEAGDALRTLSSEFEQTDHDFILEDEETSRGKLYVRLPGRIRWEYAPPGEKVLLVKEEIVRLYNPASNQVQEFERGEGGSTGGADLLVGFGKGNARIGENYDVTLLSEDAESAVLKLVPKPDSKASLFTAIELTIDKSTWTPSRSVFHEPNRDRTVIRFTSMSVNEALPDGVFELDLPDDVEVIRN